MVKPNYSFEKRQRDLAKKQKQEEKRRQKLANKAAAAGGGQDGEVGEADASSPDAQDAAATPAESKTPPEA